MSKQRTGSRRWLALICLFLGLRGVGVAYTVLAERDLYFAHDAAGPWWLRVGLYGAWGGLFLALAWGIWRRRPWAHRRVMSALAGYALTSGLYFVAFAQTEYDRGRIPSLAATSALGLGLSLWLWVRVRRQFGEQTT